MALNETLTEGKDIRDGVAITRKMWSRDFHGKSKNIIDLTNNNYFKNK